MQKPAAQHDSLIPDRAGVEAGRPHPILVHMRRLERAWPLTMVVFLLAIIGLWVIG